MKYEINRVYGKTFRLVAGGSLAYTEGGGALAMSETSIVACLHRARLVFINPDGIMLSGFEEDGISNTGVKYKYSEWFCRYLP